MCNCQTSDSVGYAGNISSIGTLKFAASSANSLATATILNSLLNDLDRLSNRITNATNDLARNNDRVLGATPQSCENQKEKLGPSGQIFIAQDLVNRLHDKMTFLEMEIERLNNL